MHRAILYSLFFDNSISTKLSHFLSRNYTYVFISWKFGSTQTIKQVVHLPNILSISSRILFLGNRATMSHPRVVLFTRFPLPLYIYIHTVKLESSIDLASRADRSVLIVDPDREIGLKMGVVAYRREASFSACLSCLFPSV